MSSTQLLITNIRQQHAIKVIKSHGPYRFFVTLTFQYFLANDEEGIEYASLFLRRLHRNMFGRKWRSIEPIRGSVTLEHACIKKRSHGKDRGNCHFHMLLKDHEKFSKCNWSAIRKLNSAVKAAGNALNYQQTSKLVSKHGTKTKFVRDNGIINYITKEARDFSWWDEDRFFLLGNYELVPAQIPRPKERDTLPLAAIA